METTSLNLTGMPKIIDEIFNLKAKRNEAATSELIELFLASTHNLWIVCKPYLKSIKAELVQEIDLELKQLYTLITSKLQISNKFTNERDIFRLNFSHYWSKIMDLNAKIEQLLYDCDVLGGRYNG